jgi:hypothetical protein
MEFFGFLRRSGKSPCSCDVERFCAERELDGYLATTLAIVRQTFELADNPEIQIDAFVAEIPALGRDKIRLSYRLA